MHLHGEVMTKNEQELLTALTHVVGEIAVIYGLDCRAAELDTLLGLCIGEWGTVKAPRDQAVVTTTGVVYGTSLYHELNQHLDMRYEVRSLNVRGGSGGTLIVEAVLKPRDEL